MKFTNVATFVALIALGVCSAARTGAEIDGLAAAVAVALASDNAANLKSVEFKTHKLDQKEIDAIKSSDNKSADAIKAILTNISVDENVVKPVPDVSKKAKLDKLILLGETVGALKGQNEEKLKEVLSATEIEKLKTVTEDSTVVDLHLLDSISDEVKADASSWFTKKNLSIGGISLVGIAALAGVAYYFIHGKAEETTDL